MPRRPLVRAILSCCALVCAVPAAASYIQYNTKGPGPFAEEQNLWVHHDVTADPDVRNVIRVDGTWYFWFAGGDKVWTWPDRKRVFSAGPLIRGIRFASWHPAHGLVLACELNTGRDLTYGSVVRFWGDRCWVSARTGRKIEAWGARYEELRAIQRFGDRYVFRAQDKKDFMWEFIDCATGKPVAELGRHRSLGFAVQVGGRQFYLVENADEQYYVDAATGKPVTARYSACADVWRAGERVFVQARIQAKRFLVELGGAGKVIGPFGDFRLPPQEVDGAWVFAAEVDAEQRWYDLEGKPRSAAFKNVTRLERAGGRWYFSARTREWKKRYVEYPGGKVHGADTETIEDLQDVDSRAWCVVKLPNAAYVLDLQGGRRLGPYRTVSRIVKAAGKNVFMAAVRPEGQTRDEWSWIDLATGRETWGRFDEISMVETVAGKQYFRGRLDKQGAYVDCATGKPVGGWYNNLHPSFKAGARHVFVAKAADGYHIVDLATGNRLHGPYKYMSTDSWAVGGKRLVEVSREKAFMLVDVLTGVPASAAYDSIYGHRQYGDSMMAVVRNYDPDRYAYLDMATGKPVAGQFQALSGVFNIGDRWIFWGRRDGASRYYDLAGSPLWDSYDSVEAVKEYYGRFVFKARLAGGKRMCYVDTATGKPWGGVFEEVKEVRNQKGVVSYEARSGDAWKAVFPFQHLEYSGMRFAQADAGKKLYPSRMHDGTKRTRVLGEVTLENPFDEEIEVRLELSSPAFPVFYGKLASTLGTVVTVKPGARVTEKIELPFSDKYWELLKARTVNAALTASLKTPSGREGKQTIDLSFTVAARDRVLWDDLRRAAAFANVEDPAIVELAKAVKELAATRNWRVPPRIDALAKAYELVRALGIRYSYMSTGMGAEDSVLLPHEVVAGKLAKCTDTVALYAALLSRLGHSSVVATFEYERGGQRIAHLMLLVDTGVNADDWRFLHRDRSMLVVPKGTKRCYIPVETTGMVSEDGKSSDFLEAWRRGVVQFRQHEAQMLKAENAFRVEAAWAAGFRQMNPATTARFTYPGQTLQDVKATVRAVLSRYATEHLGDKAAEAALRAGAAGNDAASHFALGKFLFTVRRFADARASFARAAELVPRDPEARYLLLACLVYVVRTDDAAVEEDARAAAREEFAKHAVAFSALLGDSVAADRARWAWHYDLAKWCESLGAKPLAERHRQFQLRIREALDRAKAKPYSDETVAQLKKKGFSAETIRTLRLRGVDPAKLLALAGRGFSEATLLRTLGKGFSEDDLVSFATKGFSEDDLVSFATKGFSEDDLVSFATKGQSEEDWSVSRGN